MHREYSSFGDGGGAESVAEGEEFVLVGPYHAGGDGSHVHDVEEGFEDLGRGIDGDGFVRDAFGLEEVSEVGAGDQLGTCHESSEARRGRGIVKEMNGRKEKR
jgi:hypothetical protein